MAKNKRNLPKSDNIKCWQGCQATLTHTFLVGMQNGQVLLKSLVLLYKVKHRILIRCSDPTPRYVPRKI